MPEQCYGWHRADDMTIVFTRRVGVRSRQEFARLTLSPGVLPPIMTGRLFEVFHPFPKEFLDKLCASMDTGEAEIDSARVRNPDPKEGS